MQILVVDDDPEVLRAVERDLKRKYGRDYRVLSAASGEDGLELLRQVSVRGEPVALLLADQRMPRMSGVEFLEAAVEYAPTARRAILTAYSDIDAAIGAINRALERPAPVLVVAHGALFRAIRAAMGLPPNIRTPNGVPMLCEPGTPWTLMPA